MTIFQMCFSLLNFGRSALDGLLGLRSSFIWDTYVAFRWRSSLFEAYVHFVWKSSSHRNIGSKLKSVLFSYLLSFQSDSIQFSTTLLVSAFDLQQGYLLFVHFPFIVSVICLSLCCGHFPCYPDAAPKVLLAGQSYHFLSWVLIFTIFLLKVSRSVTSISKI